MSFRLKSYDQSPPGNYPYVQTEGIRREFPAQPLIEAQARIVSDFRQGNGLPRASLREALEDIDTYTCLRLGGLSHFCVSTDAKTRQVALSTASPIIAPCAGCGAKVS